MKATTVFHRSLAAAAAAAVIVLAGCESDSKPIQAPPPQAAKPAIAAAQDASISTLAQFRTELVTGQQQIDRVLASLRKLTDPTTTDLRTAYNDFSNQVARMNQHAEVTRREAVAMRQARADYFGKWEQKVAEIDNPTIRASADARRKRLRDAQEQITANAMEAGDAYQPFMKDLQDIRRYLAGDLSRKAILDIGDAVKVVNANGATVRAKIIEAVRILDEVQGAE